MNFQIHPFAIILVITACISNAVILTLTAKQKNNQSTFGALVMIAITVWMIGAAIELASTTKNAIEFSMYVQFTGICIAPLLWLAYTYAYTDKLQSLSPKKYIGYSLSAAVLLTLVYTNDIHGLVFPRITLKHIGSYVIASFDFNLGFWLIIGYVFLVLFIGISLLIQSYYQAGGIFRWELLALLGSILFPLVSFIAVDRFGISPLLKVRVAPFAFGVVVPIVAILLNQLHNLDLMPYARDIILDNIGDAVIIVNRKNHIIDMNATAEELLAAEGKKWIGASLKETGIPLEIPRQGLQNRVITQKVIQLNDQGTPKRYTLRVTPISDRRDVLLGNVILLSNITDIKQLSLELGSLLDTTQAISSTMKLEDVLAFIAEKIPHTLNADGCRLFYWDKEFDALVNWIEYRQQEIINKDHPGTVYALQHFPSTRNVLENWQAVSVKIDDPDLEQAEIVYMQSVGATSLLLLPMIAGDEVIGLVKIDHSGGAREFSMAYIRLAQALSNQAAIAIKNAWLLSETQRRMQEQTILREAAMAISSALELDQVLTQIASQMCSAVDATSAYICDYDKALGRSTVRAEYLSENASEQEKASDLGKSYLESEPEFIEKLENGRYDFSYIDDEEIPESERNHMREHGCQSIVYIPLMVKGDPIGFVEIWESRFRREFSKEEINLCQAIANHAAIALENARLFEMAQVELGERKRVEEKLSFEATHDDLTGLPNRKIFLERLDQVCSQHSTSNGKSFAVLFLDFDRFKVVNDSLGHSSGDQLLIESARRIQECLRPTDLLARLGGDEFTILLEGISHLEYAVRVADRVQEMIKLPFIIEGREVYISTSIGILFDQAKGQRSQDLIRDADIAMYRAKERGKARYVVYSPELHAEAMTRLEMEAALRQALKNQELAVHYQPIFSLASGYLVGFEALVRWLHPVEGNIAPSKFIHLAEETGLIVQIDRWVLDEACNQMATWEKKYPRKLPLTISVNLSGQSLNRPQLPQEIQSVLLDHNLPPERLHLEITESTVMDHAQSTLTLLTHLQKFGVKLFIDDFGTGYSSLSYLHRFPLDGIKIDRSFIRNMQESEMSSGLVSTIIKLAHTLNMTVVAEGVETLSQKTSLERMECEEAQGFYFAHPMDKAEFEIQFLQSEKGYKQIP